MKRLYLILIVLLLLLVPSCSKSKNINYNKDIEWREDAANLALYLNSNTPITTYTYRTKPFSYYINGNDIYVRVAIENTSDDYVYVHHYYGYSYDIYYRYDDNKK